MHGIYNILPLPHREEEAEKKIGRRREREARAPAMNM